jgi:Ca-activated chloride channel homolog
MNQNDQKPDDLLNSLEQAVPPADTSAKKRAIALAMAEFDLAKNQSTQTPLPTQTEVSEKKLFSFQGFLDWLRPTGTNPQSASRSDTMKMPSKKFLLGGLATASVAAVGLVMLQNHNPVVSTLPQPVLIDENQLVQQPAKNEIETKGQDNLTAKVLTNTDEYEEVVVAGVQESLANAPDSKRSGETIVVENIDKFPDDKIEAALKQIETMEPEPAAPIAVAESNARMEQLKEQKAKSTERDLMASRAAVISANKKAEAEYAGVEEVVVTGATAAKPALIAPAPMADIQQSQPEEFRDRFKEFKDNTVKSVAEEPVSTFSIDVDTASYSFVRRMLNNGQLPQKDMVRQEELINYFDYHYPISDSRKTPFTTSVNLMDSPWKKGNKLIHIAIQGYQLPAKEIPQTNLVFLLDVSGSMDEPDKLPLVKQSMSLLLDTLRPDDTISIAVYAGAAGTVLEPTKAKDKTKILAALNNLQAGGSTAGAEGIELAYQLAEANFNPKGVNRIILATDGDFNVGQTDDSALQDMVERKREKGIFLSVLGFGQGNYQDAMMQTLAQNGNGTAAYIDTLSEAQKVLVTEATSNLFPIAKDVKIQVEFNPNTVAEYRLIGYETRALNREDFNNDKIDAGEIGAGQRVTAIYEITPFGQKGLLEPSRYKIASTTNELQAAEYAFVRLRYKLPKEDKSNLVETPVLIKAKEANAGMQSEVKFSVAVAGFAQLLRGGQFMEDFSYDDVIKLAQESKGEDEFGYRNEFIQLVRKAKIAK